MNVRDPSITTAAGADISQRRATVVDTWFDAIEVLRASTAIVGSQVDRTVVRGDTLVQLDGVAHDTRRRAMNRLVRGSTGAHLRDDVFRASLLRELSSVLESPDRDGIARTDLMALLIRCGVELGAAITGIRETSDTRRRRLCEIEDVLSRVAIEEASGRESGGCRPEALALARKMRRSFTREFFRPELAKRRASLDAGQELGDDLMSLIAAVTDPGWANEQTAIKEVVGIIRGAARPTAGFLCASLDHLDMWVRAHPEDRGCLRSAEFLAGAIHETLRLRTPLLSVSEDEAEQLLNTIYRPRRRVMVSDVTTTSGQAFSAGEIVAVDTRSAARDTAVFGQDANEYNPRRRALEKSTYPWGLAFGTGPHMCLGLPIVLGTYGADGAIVQAVKLLFDIGLSIDREQPRRLLPQLPYSFGPAFRTRSFPVAFARPR